MTGKERMLNLINGKKTDRIVWSALINQRTLSEMPDEFKNMTAIEFCKYIGCDIFQFGFCGISPTYQASTPCKLIQTGTHMETEKSEDGTVTRKIITEWGVLTAVYRNGHPVKHPVENGNDLKILRRIWENSKYQETSGIEEAYERLNKAIGDQGIYVPTVKPSVIQSLIEYDMGVSNFYYLLTDYREEMEKMFEIIHNCRRQEYEILARRSPAQAVISVENTSTRMISPEIYERYSLHHVTDFADIMHRYGKKAILHMCGHVKNLLEMIKKTGLDGIDALTPPPLGDTTAEQALDVLGDNMIILSGLNKTVFINKDSSEDQIFEELEKTFTLRIKQAKGFILRLEADGTPVPLKNFLAVKKWIETLSY